MADPVGIGLVASLAHPGGNVTGLSQIFASLGGKRLELLKATAPWISRVVVLRGPGGQGAARSVQQTQEAGRPLGLEVRGLEVKGPSELGSAFESLAEWGAEAVITVPNFWTPSQKGAVGQFVAQHHLPSMHEQPEYVDGGGLLAYGPSVPDMWRRAADYVDKILRGTSPADLPVEQPTRFNFIINLKTAQALGLTIPQQVLLQATEIIQ
jgi:putative ABC transport system substrate-binding protein